MQIIAFTSATLILFIGAFMWAIKYDKEGLQPKEIPNGISAIGIILDFYKTGSKFSQSSGGLDDVYQMFISLRITDKNGNFWKTSTREFVPESQFDMYRIGDTIHVKYDPEDSNNVVVDGDWHKRYHP